MIFLYLNIGSHAIVLPIFTALASILMPTTASGGIDGKVEKQQDNYQDKKKEDDVGT